MKEFYLKIDEMKFNINFNFIPYIIISILLVLIFFNTCSGEKRIDEKQPVKTDTITIIKKIKGETIVKKETEFIPKVIYKTDPKYLAEIDKLKTEKEKLEKTLSDLRTRIYDTTYTFDSGTLRVKDSVQGYLRGRDWKLTLNDIEIEERTIKETYHKYPKFALSVGGNVQLETDFKSYIQKPTLGAEVGFRNKAGYNLDLGYNFSNQFRISLKKDIFVHYGKD